MENGTSPHQRMQQTRQYPFITYVDRNNEQQKYAARYPPEHTTLFSPPSTVTSSSFFNPPQPTERIRMMMSEHPNYYQQQQQPMSKTNIPRPAFIGFNNNNNMSPTTTRAAAPQQRQQSLPPPNFHQQNRQNFIDPTVIYATATKNSSSRTATQKQPNLDSAPQSNLLLNYSHYPQSIRPLAPLPVFVQQQNGVVLRRRPTQLRTNPTYTGYPPPSTTQRQQIHHHRRVPRSDGTTTSGGTVNSSDDNNDGVDDISINGDDQQQQQQQQNDERNNNIEINHFANDTQMVEDRRNQQRRAEKLPPQQQQQQPRQLPTFQQQLWAATTAKPLDRSPLEPNQHFPSQIQPPSNRPPQSARRPTQLLATDDSTYRLPAQFHHHNLPNSSQLQQHDAFQQQSTAKRGRPKAVKTKAAYNGNHTSPSLAQNAVNGWETNVKLVPSVSMPSEHHNRARGKSPGDKMRDKFNAWFGSTGYSAQPHHNIVLPRAHSNAAAARNNKTFISSPTNFVHTSSAGHQQQPMSSPVVQQVQQQSSIPSAPSVHAPTMLHYFQSQQQQQQQQPPPSSSPPLYIEHFDTSIQHHRLSTLSGATSTLSDGISGTDVVVRGCCDLGSPTNQRQRQRPQQQQNQRQQQPWWLDERFKHNTANPFDQNDRENDYYYHHHNDQYGFILGPSVEATVDRQQDEQFERIDSPVHDKYTDPPPPASAEQKAGEREDELDVQAKRISGSAFEESLLALIRMRRDEAKLLGEKKRVLRLLDECRTNDEKDNKLVSYLHLIAIINEQLDGLTPAIDAVQERITGNPAPPRTLHSSDADVSFVRQSFRRAPSAENDNVVTEVAPSRSSATKVQHRSRRQQQLQAQSPPTTSYWANEAIPPKSAASALATPARRSKSTANESRANVYDTVDDSTAADPDLITGKALAEFELMKQQVEQLQSERKSLEKALAGLRNQVDRQQEQHQKQRTLAFDDDESQPKILRKDSSHPEKGVVLEPPKISSPAVAAGSQQKHLPEPKETSSSKKPGTAQRSSSLSPKFEPFKKVQLPLATKNDTQPTVDDAEQAPNAIRYWHEREKSGDLNEPSQKQVPDVDAVDNESKRAKTPPPPQSQVKVPPTTENFSWELQNRDAKPEALVHARTSPTTTPTKSSIKSPKLSKIQAADVVWSGSKPTPPETTVSPTHVRFASDINAKEGPSQLEQLTATVSTFDGKEEQELKPVSSENNTAGNSLYSRVEKTVPLPSTSLAVSKCPPRITNNAAESSTKLYDFTNTYQTTPTQLPPEMALAKPVLSNQHSSASNQTSAPFSPQKPRRISLIPPPSSTLLLPSPIITATNTSTASAVQQQQQKQLSAQPTTDSATNNPKTSRRLGSLLDMKNWSASWLKPSVSTTLKTTTVSQVNEPVETSSVIKASPVTPTRKFVEPPRPRGIRRHHTVAITIPLSQMLAEHEAAEKQKRAADETSREEQNSVSKSRQLHLGSLHSVRHDEAYGKNEYSKTDTVLTPESIDQSIGPPDKVDIPRRYMSESLSQKVFSGDDADTTGGDSDSSKILSPSQRVARRRKADSIRRMLTGSPTNGVTVHDQVEKDRLLRVTADLAQQAKERSRFIINAAAVTATINSHAPRTSSATPSPTTIFHQTYREESSSSLPLSTSDFLNVKDSAGPGGVTRTTTSETRTETHLLLSEYERTIKLKK